MNTHKNAPLTPKGREAMVRCVEAGLSKAAAARQFNTTPKTAAKWVERFRAGGVDGSGVDGGSARTGIWCFFSAGPAEQACKEGQGDD